MQDIVLLGLFIIFISAKTKSDNAYFNTDANTMFDVGSGEGSGLEDFFSDNSENEVKVFGGKPVNFDVGFQTGFWYPQLDVCQTGPKGRVPWILQTRESDYGWKENTHRAMIALAVNDYRGDEREMKKMKLQLEIELILSLSRNKTHCMLDSDLTLYIHSLLAINKNPRNFYGVDLVADLLHRVEDSTRQVNPFLVLALCNSRIVKHQHLLKMMDFITASLIDLYMMHFDADRKIELLAFAFKALACIAEINNRRSNFKFAMEKIAYYLRRKYNEENGSFGNVYATSSAVQAFTAVSNPPRWWNKNKSLEYLERESEIDVNLIKAYYIEMALNAQKYKFIKDLYKGPPLVPYIAEPKADVHYIQYTVKPNLNSDMYYTITMNVKSGANFYDVMKKASNVSAPFNFAAYENNNGDPMVYSVSGIPNDVEENTFWRLCRQTDVEHGDRQRYASRIEAYDASLMNVMPKKEDHYIYLYSSRECELS